MDKTIVVHEPWLNYTVTFYVGPDALAPRNKPRLLVKRWTTARCGPRRPGVIGLFDWGLSQASLLGLGWAEGHVSHSPYHTHLEEVKNGS